MTTIEPDVVKETEKDEFLAPHKEEFFDEQEDGGPDVSQNGSNKKRVSDYGKWTVTQGDDKNPFITELSGLQLLVARQHAALALHKYVDKWFSHSKLLQIAEGPKRSIWSKMFNFNKKKQSKKFKINFN